jgi:hypothetical protein
VGRVVSAFFIAPLLVSLAYGPLVIVVYPMFLIVMLVLGAPLFLAFRRLGWLSWWHAVLVGVMCSTAGMYFDLGSNPVRAEMYGPSHTISFATMGAGVGLLFWWLALFRNERYPGISRNPPKSMLWLVPLAVLAWVAYDRVEAFDVRARLQGPGGPPAPGGVAKSTARMVLPTGEPIAATVLREGPLPAAGTCAHLVGRRASFLSDDRQYWVLLFMDEHFKDYDKC